MFLGTLAAGACWHAEVCSRFYIHSNVLTSQIFRFHLLLPSYFKGVQRADHPLALLLLYSSQLYSLFRIDISAQMLVFKAWNTLLVVVLFTTPWKQCIGRLLVQENSKPFLFSSPRCVVSTVSLMFFEKYWMFCSCLWASPDSLVSGNIRKAYRIFIYCLDNILVPLR